jgi:Zn-dependent membrane protease YugP
MFYSGGFGLYFLFALPALLLGFWAQFKVQSAYKTYSQVRTSNGLTGAEIARRILDSNHLEDIRIEQVSGTLSDHYDPSKRILSLSQGVFGGNSISAAGVAAHESGHAIQHKLNYGPLALRSLMVPSVQIGSWLGPIIFIVGMLFSSDSLALVGLILFAATAVFTLVTIPVEMDASRRAKESLSSTGLIYGSEVEGVSKVLDAAALTYVAAAVQALSTLLYYVFLFTGSRRRS